jgi:uncharacterized protein YehS (DUF1456 family)
LLGEETLTLTGGFGILKKNQKLRIREPSVEIFFNNNNNQNHRTAGFQSLKKHERTLHERADK